MKYEIKPREHEDVEVSFRMNYSDWRRFEKSRLWHQLEEVVRRLQYKPYDGEEYEEYPPMEYRVAATIARARVPYSAVIAFSLSYRDWCELRDSQLWHQVEAAIRSIQSKYSR